MKDPLTCDSSLVQIEALDGFETEPEVKYETMEFDFIHPSMELVNHPVCNESEPISCNDIGEEESLITHTIYESSELIPDEELPEDSTIAPTKNLQLDLQLKAPNLLQTKKIKGEDSMITHPVHESSELFPDKELLEESSIAPSVVKSSNASLDKEVSEEESLIAPSVSENTQDEGVLEDESE
ncbi:hypothetical protein Tco_0166647 [Tanacetum coccineum]